MFSRGRRNPVCVLPELVSVYAMQISSTTAKTTAATASTLVNKNLVATPTAPPASTYAGIPSGSMRPQPASVSARSITTSCSGSSPSLCTASADGKALYVVSDPFGPEVRSNDDPSAASASVSLPTISPPASIASFLGDLPVGAVVDTGMTKEQGGTGCRVRAPAADGIYSSCQGKMASGFQFMEGGASQCDKMVDKFQKEMGGIPYDEMPIVAWYRDPADGVTNDWDMCGKVRKARGQLSSTGAEYLRSTSTSPPRARRCGMFSQSWTNVPLALESRRGVLAFSPI